MAQSSVKKMSYAAILIALSLIIPLAFSFLRVTLGPFTATLASHVPLMIAMLISPAVAAVVGVGSGIGFLLTASPVVAARAFMHTAVGFTGGLAVKKGFSFPRALLICAPVHALLEALVVIPFGLSAYQYLVVVGVGTLLHHFADAAISLAVVRSLHAAHILPASSKATVAR